jgi:hypothetical protein
MLDQAIVRTGIKFGVSCALAGFLVVLVLYFAGLNPYGQLIVWGWIFIPVAIFWGLNYFKKFNDQQLSFVKALKVGWAIAFYTALCSAMLLYVFSIVAGLEPIQRHIAEMKMLMDASREAAMQTKVMTKETFEQTYSQLDKTTPYMLAFDDFIKKFFVGFLSAIVGAVFFRK